MTPSQAYYASIKDDRNAWRDQFDHCMFCGRHLPRRDMGETHEIDSKSHCSQTWGHRCNYLLLCSSKISTCHVTVENLPHAQQLALKLDNDPDAFDLDAWLRLRDPELRAPQRVTLDEVIAARTENSKLRREMAQ